MINCGLRKYTCPAVILIVIWFSNMQDVNNISSANFKPLQLHWPQLYDHAAFSEEYVYSDPHASGVKLRCFVETLVGILYRGLGIPCDLGGGLNERMKAPAFKKAVGGAIAQKLNALRYLGNRAAHGEKITTADALALIKDAYLIGRWLYKAYGPPDEEPYPEYVMPVKPCVAPGNLANNTTFASAKADLGQVEAFEMSALAQHQASAPDLDELRLEAFSQAASKAERSFNLEPNSTSSRVRLADAFVEYTLNSGQAELVQQLDAFLSKRDEDVFLLKGYAGTGKTFIIKGLTDYFEASGRNFVLAAPTGKAAKVISTKTGQPAYTIHKTIYSYKDLVEYQDDKVDGTETYKLYTKLRINEHSADTVFIVDEASMFSDVYQESEFFRAGSGYLLRDFLEFVNLDHNDHAKKVIFIGDDAQLQPIGMNFSPALDADYLYRQHRVRAAAAYELTDVVRQKADSGVMINSITVRKALKAKIFNQLAVDWQYPDLHRVEHADLIEQYLNACGGQVNDEAIVISHANADVAANNRRIREQFFPGCSQIVAGDRIMAVSNSYQDGTFISNGEFGRIEEVLGKPEVRPVTLKRLNPETKQVVAIEVDLRFRDVRVTFGDLDGVARTYQVKILEDLLYNDQPTLTSDENKALYLDFCLRHRHLLRGSDAFKDTLKTDPYFTAMRVKFGYAITCHKAQGSEWKHVFVKCNTMQKQLTAEYFRWFYTAITRTSGHLYLLDAPNRKPGDDMAVVRPPTAARLWRKNAGQMVPSVSPADLQVPLSVTPPAPLHDESAERFGIPQDEHFLLSVLREVRRLVAGYDIAIGQIDHHQYQEAYHFTRREARVRVSVRYNAKQKITGLDAYPISEFGTEVRSLLAPLQGTPMVTQPASEKVQFSFDKPFLQDFHDRVSVLTSAHGIAIQHVQPLQYCQRYSFVRGREVAVYDFYYNGRSQFATRQALITACSPGTLVDEVEQLLAEGLRA